MDAFLAFGAADILMRSVAHDAKYQDHLTKLWNRRFLDTFGPWVIESATALRQQVLFFSADVDGLSQLNAAYGYHVGDAFIRAVANGFLASVADPDDIVGRYGSDEFVGIWRRPGEDIVLRIRNRIIEALTILNREMQESIPTFSIVSASCGFAIFPDDGSNHESLIAKARATGRHEKLALTELQTVSSAANVGRSALTVYSVNQDWGDRK